MSIVDSRSIVYQIISGEYKGKKCVLIENIGLREDCGVIFDDSNGNDMVYVPKRFLSQLNIPGWETKIYDQTYGLIEFMSEESHSGRCMLRTTHAAQPKALRQGDVLATGELVVENPRRGYNSSILIHLDKTGWVELAPRFPIALKGNRKFKLAAELVLNENLLTTCEIVSSPVCIDINWVAICFNHPPTAPISIPSCIPLALS
ncbi:MAG: hypothetical protein WCK10_01205 [Candidatus Staskawiczbacteria bacterium]